MSSLRVKRDRPSVKRQGANLNYYLEYQGSENPLIFENNYDMTLSCGLELYLYPFDTQHCFINVSGSSFLTTCNFCQTVRIVSR